MSWKLPDGWTSEVLGNGQCLLEWPTHGFVTVSAEHRNFRLGQTKVYQTAYHVYSGRGWRDRLFNDAVAALKEIYKDEQ